MATKNHEKLKIFKNPFRSGKNIPKPARTPSLSKIIPLVVFVEARGQDAFFQLPLEMAPTVVVSY